MARTYKQRKGYLQSYMREYMRKRRIHAQSLGLDQGSVARRRAAIIRLIRRSGGMSAREVSETIIVVSPQTIYKDLQYLVSSGEILAVRWNDAGYERVIYRVAVGQISEPTD